MVGGLRVEPVTERLGFTAGRLRTRHYDRERRAISIANCIALALALDLGDRLATSDAALLETARAEDCRVIALPDSLGGVAGVASPERPDKESSDDAAGEQHALTR